MAGKKTYVATKVTKKGAKTGRLVVGTADFELRKAFDKFRKDFAGLVGEVSRVDADMKKGVEVAKSAKGSVSKLIKDPLVSVPQDLARKVEVLENEVKRLKVKLAERALVTSLDSLRDKLSVLDTVVGNVGELYETTGDHGDRLVALEDQATNPTEHAHPPDHPKPDPRQTTLDQAIERSRTKTTEVPVIEVPQPAVTPNVRGGAAVESVDEQAEAGHQ